MLAFLPLSLQHLAVVIERLDYQFFLFPGSGIFAEILIEFIAFDGNVVLLRLFLLHHQFHAVPVELSFLRCLFHALRL